MGVDVVVAIMLGRVGMSRLVLHEGIVEFLVDLVVRQLHHHVFARTDLHRFDGLASLLKHLSSAGVKGRLTLMYPTCHGLPEGNRGLGSRNMQQQNGASGTIVMKQPALNALFDGH